MRRVLTCLLISLSLACSEPATVDPIPQSQPPPDLAELAELPDLAMPGPPDAAMACRSLGEAACAQRSDCVTRRGPACPGCPGAVFQACARVELSECGAREASCPGLDSCASAAGAACAACAPDPEPCPGAVFPAPETSLYLLPYPAGVTRNVRQGNCNAANTHYGSEAYAYDFEMPIGSPILAARGGRVFAVIEEFTDDQHELNQGNLVAIDHGDQTYAKYGHLTFQGSLVNVGDVVKQGALIARSGNSGASRAPHLHFAVKACPVGVPVGSASCNSVPTSFRNTLPHPHGLIGSPTSDIGGGSWYPACAVP